MMQPNQIPLFVEADTKQELVSKMAKINSVGIWHNFFSIQEDSKGKWVAWYYEDIQKMIKKNINDSSINKGTID